MAEENNDVFPLGKENYKFILIGVVLVALGLILMVGGGAENLDEFNREEIFSFRTITLAPFTMVVGLAVVLYGIMKKPK